MCGTEAMVLIKPRYLCHLEGACSTKAILSCLSLDIVWILFGYSLDCLEVLFGWDSRVKKYTITIRIQGCNDDSHECPVCDLLKFPTTKTESH